MPSGRLLVTTPWNDTELNDNGRDYHQKCAPPSLTTSEVGMPATIASVLDEYLTGLRRNGLKPATLRAYGGDLGAAAATFP